MRGDPVGEGSSLGGVGDDPGGRGDVRHDRTLEVDGQARIGLEVEEPGPLAIGAGHAGDVDAAIDDVVDDLDPAGMTAPSAGRGDIDGLAVPQCTGDLVVHGGSSFSWVASGCRCARNYLTPLAGRPQAGRPGAFGPMVLPRPQPFAALAALASALRARLPAW